MKHPWSIAWKILIGIPVVLVVLFAFLQTPPGKAVLAEGISKLVARSGNVEIELGRISGFIPAQIDIEFLSIGDRDGIWLTAKQLHLRWTMKDLLDGMVNIEQLGAKSIELHRLPKAGNHAKPVGGKWKFPPMEIALGNLSIEELHLGKAIAGNPLEYTVHSGGIRLSANGEMSGALDVTGDADGRFVIAAPPQGTEDYLFKASVELKEFRKPDIGLHGLVGTATALVATDGTTLALKAKADWMELGLDARIVAVGGSWSVDVRRCELAVLDTARFTGQGSMNDEGIDLHGTLAEFDIGHLPLAGISNFTGRVAGRLSVVGPLAAPVLTAGLDILDLTTTQSALDELPDMDLHVDLDLREGRLSGNSSITSAVAGNMKAGIDMPCSFSLQPFTLNPEPERLTASFNADADLGILNGLALFSNQRIAGKLLADLLFDAQAKDQLGGRVVINGGTYEHYDWGLVVNDIQAELDAGPSGLMVKQMTATDGNGGRIEVKGGMDICKKGIPLDLQVDVEKASLIHRDEVSGMLSGSIKIGNLFSKPSVSGRLVVDRADILLDNIAPQAPRLLVNYDSTEHSNETAVAAASGESLPFTLDVAVSMPDQVFVNASVIDSVWGGELRLKDAPDGISVSGVIAPKRGYIAFVGKKFRLADDGRIELDGTIPPSPTLNITAEYSRSDIVAQLALTGKLNHPKYTLTSTPALPEDEVLSQVLFGRDTSSISPYQAFQIAAAARQLSGGVSGPGFMYQVRQALSIDTLEWREPDTADGTSSVAAGKYVASGLYVEVHSTLEEKEGKAGMMAEYELTRHFSLETSTGPKMRPGIGVNWKIDY